MNRRDFVHTAALTPILLAAGAPVLSGAEGQDDLSRKFETQRATDPIAAFKLLAENPGETAQKIARGGIARQLTQDLSLGLKAFSEAKADLVETHLVRAALLADLFSADFSKQLMRLVHLTRSPRKTTTGCAVCKGAGG